MTKKEKSFGFTLVEVLLVAVVVAISGTVLVSAMVQNSGLFFNQQSKVSQGVNSNDASSQIIDSLRQASSIAASYPSQSPTYFSGLETVVATIPAFDQSGQTIGNVYDYVVVTKDPTNPNILRKKVFPDPSSKRQSEDRVLLTKLSKINFFYLDKNGIVTSPQTAGKVAFVINLSEKTGIGSQESSTSGQIFLRNSQ